MMQSGLTLVLDRSAIAARIEMGALRLDFEDGRFQRFPLKMLERVVIHGSPSIDCGVWRTLAREGVPAALLPHRGRGPVAWLGAGLSSFAHLRVSQHQAYANESARLVLAREAVARKLMSSRLAGERMFPGAGAPPELARLQEDLASASSIDALMGIEGYAARCWFSRLQDALDDKWQFTGRNRRPPRDPVNALLSLSYTMVLAAMRRHVLAAGFDPALGFLHEISPAREALVLDLMEPLRAGADEFVLYVVNTAMDPEDFTLSEHDGCRLGKAARGTYYAMWTDWCREWPDARQPDEASDVAPADDSAESGSAVTAGNTLDGACLRAVQAFRGKLMESVDAHGHKTG